MTDGDAKKYFVLFFDTFKKVGLRELTDYVNFMRDDAGLDYNCYKPVVWSARLSTGLLGMHACPSGNSKLAPRNSSEVLLAYGGYGLRKLVDLGFITCPVCLPEQDEGFWSTVQDDVKGRYSFSEISDFADKGKLSFDARRVDWETITPALGKLPERLYVPKGLIRGQIYSSWERFARMGFKPPVMGYYDAEAPGHFREYIRIV